MKTIIILLTLSLSLNTFARGKGGKLLDKLTEAQKSEIESLGKSFKEDSYNAKVAHEKEIYKLEIDFITEEHEKTLTHLKESKANDFSLENMKKGKSKGKRGEGIREKVKESKKAQRERRKEFMKSIKEKRKAFRESQKEKRKSFRDSMKSKMKSFRESAKSVD